MKNLMSLAGIGLILSTSAHAAPPVTMSAAVKRDVQCFVLYSIAVNGAETSRDEKLKQAGSFGMMYFLGKIKVAAPELNFVEAVRQEANAFDSGTKGEEVGTACDAEFQKRGAELVDLGRQLQQPEP